MSKVKYRWITIISLLAALFLVLGFVLNIPKTKAFANTYSPSGVFSSGTGGSVGASEKGDEEGAKAYVEFTFSDNGKVYYRRDLALKWYEGKNDVKYFSMSFAFGEINFEKFTIAFESAEENISKDAKSTNEIVFTVNESDDTILDIAINEEESKLSVAKDKDIEIAFNEVGCEIGEFNLLVSSDGAAAQSAGTFKNIGGYFMEYRSSSSSTPNTPMTFTAELPEDAESGAKQTVLMKSLNGQSFELNADNRIEDNAPAVLVLNEEIYAFKLGQKFSLTYEAIDVCDDNVSVTREYYMLKKADEKSMMPNGTEIKTPADADDEAKAKYAEYEKYNYKSLTTSTYFLPSAENKDQTEYVAIRFKLDDDTDENDTYVDLSWYAHKDSIASIDCEGYKEVDNEGTKEVQTVSESFDFIKADRAKKGPYYNNLTADEATKKNVVTDEDAFEAAVKAYQDALDTAADYEKSKTSAGTGAYIYLPSLRELICSDYAGYRNLKFSIYYFKPNQSEGATASSQTSLSYNALKLEVSEMGEYKFRVIAQDSASNAMEYYLDGELVTVTSSNVWDIEGIPEFSFNIDYKGPTIEESEEQSLGYRNETYTFSDFDVVALSGYQKEYTLYRYNSANVPTGVSLPSSYSDFVENAETYYKTFKQLDDAQTDNGKKIFYEISAFQDDVDEDDEAKWNRTDNDYYWSPDSSLSFVPQEQGFYVLKLVVKDKVLLGKTAEAYQVIEVRNPIDTIPGQSQWLQENVVSVVLFAISGVLAIVVVVLFLIKPAEKKVEEVDLEKLKGSKKSKSKKK